MILAAASGLPPEYQTVFTKPEVIALVVGLISAVLIALTAIAMMAKRWADRKFSPISEQVVNNHGKDGKDVNLREQIDEMQAEMREGFRRMDNQFGEVHDRQIQQDRRIQGVENRASEEHARIWKMLED